ncbi:hypothetical protein B0J13DRAFT_79825 [Dactylonectria estremocensis]|uniref:Secreted protein n=1 Tax=Dactylonectria estremocensis TaxID=1079267 RepID=A0A9P9EHH2_9HYPO|nr:hypothetical protein B0J13DRAFT_79825 [Dactylonectria estremocensis]
MLSCSHVHVALVVVCISTFSVITEHPPTLALTIHSRPRISAPPNPPFIPQRYNDCSRVDAIAVSLGEGQPTQPTNAPFL